MVLHSPDMTRGQRTSQSAAYMGYKHPEPWAETLHRNYMPKETVYEVKQNIFLYSLTQSVKYFTL